VAKRKGLSSFMGFIGRTLYHLKMYDLEKIPAQGACVIVWNHVSMFADSYTIGAFMSQRPDSIAFMGSRLASQQKRRQAKNKGKSDQSTALAAYKARGLSAGELLKALKYLQEGRAITIAPEGEMSWDGRLQHPLTPGAAWMALRGHVPVVPVVQFGGYDIHPRWKSWPYLTGRITIRAGDPFFLHDTSQKQVTDEQIRDASQRIYDEMAALLALRHEVPGKLDASNRLSHP
jgi:1-acyl-sn-glycerol-3-phosphate acyltransferase